MQNPQEPLKVFISYSHKDMRLKEKLITHLNSLIRQKYICLWYDNMILPGKEIKDEIATALRSSQIVLLLLSADYLSSNYCYQEEMQEALKLHGEKKLMVIPIILRVVDLKGTPIDDLLSLPEDRKAVTQFHNEDIAFKNIADGIRRIVERWYYESVPDLNNNKSNFSFTGDEKKNIPTTQYNCGFQINGSIINGGTFKIER